VQSYFRAATLRSAAPKLRGLIRSVEDLDVLVVRSEAEALLTESQLIKDYRPRYNVSFKDDKRFLMLRVDPREPVPIFKAVRFAREDGARYFGPWGSSAAARAALDFVDRQFGLRRCRPVRPGEEDYRHCINDIVRYCSAPCVGRVTAAEYLERVEGACAFLRGENPGLLGRLEEQMAAAAQAQDYERAAALRDSLLLLRRVVQRRLRVAHTPELRLEEAEAGLRELQGVLGLERPPETIECYDISNISGTYSVASLVCAVRGQPQRQRYRRFRIRTVEGSDDPAMMAEVIRRRFDRLREQGGPPPDLVVVDGGLTQLRAAQRELAAAGAAGVAVAGIAKREEELYVADRAAPVALREHPRALHVLQRIRDEAHRFALDYHRRLRARRIRESVLDEIPGVGGSRKEELLKHFGSVTRLRHAPLEAIAAVKGIGPKLAALIQARLG
jgi:excinuclease ABC subunit C